MGIKNIIGDILHPRQIGRIIRQCFGSKPKGADQMNGEKSIAELAKETLTPAAGPKKKRPKTTKRRTKATTKRLRKELQKGIKAPAGTIRKRAKRAPPKRSAPTVGDGRGRPRSEIAKPRNNQERLAVAVHSARLKLKLRAAVAAKKAGITVGYWNKIERAVVKLVPLDTIKAVFRVLAKTKTARFALLKIYNAEPRKGDKVFVSPPRHKKAKVVKTKRTKKATGKKKPAAKKKAA